ncbi:MAG TPA: glycosyltransferase family 1 protein [Acidobacteriota bacterium]
MPLIIIDGRKLDDFGIGRYLEGLLGALARRADPWSYAVPCRAERAAWIEALGPRFRALPSRLPLYSLRELGGFGAPLRALRPALLHAPHYVLPLRLPCPALVTIHDPIHLLFPAWWSRPGRYLYARWMMRSAARRAQRVIAVSASAAADLRLCLGLPQDALEVIPNGGGEPRSAPAAAPSAPTGDYLLFVGNPLPHKNLAGLLCAYAVYRARQAAPAELLIAGGAAPVAAPGVRSLGRVGEPELLALYRAARAVVIPSLYEGFGLVLLEALREGVPALASDLPALRELAEDAALFVDPRDGAAWAAGIERILGDKPLRARLRREGPARARRFSWERSAAAHARLYDELIGPGP